MNCLDWQLRLPRDWSNITATQFHLHQIILSSSSASLVLFPSSFISVLPDVNVYTRIRLQNVWMDLRSFLLQSTMSSTRTSTLVRGWDRGLRSYLLFDLIGQKLQVFFLNRIWLAGAYVNPNPMSNEKLLPFVAQTTRCNGTSLATPNVSPFKAPVQCQRLHCGAASQAYLNYDNMKLLEQQKKQK